MFALLEISLSQLEEEQVWAPVSSSCQCIQSTWWDAVSLQLLALIFDDDLLQYNAEQTNLYSCQLIGTRINTTVNELKLFVGIKIIVGMVRMQSMDDNWAESTCYPKIDGVVQGLNPSK